MVDTNGGGRRDGGARSGPRRARGDSEAATLDRWSGWRFATACLLPLALCALVAAPAAAQDRDPAEAARAEAAAEDEAAHGEGAEAGPSPAAARMAALGNWSGHWKGSGWIRRGPGEPAKFDGEEWVEARLGGEAMIVEGRHVSADTGQLVHHALALLTWDEEAGTYRFRTHVAGHGPGEFTGRIDDGAFVWGGAMGGGEMRYTIEIDGDTWHEVGHFSRDGGESWQQFFEMTLERVGGAADGRGGSGS